MASAKELDDLFNAGELGKLLVKAFHGERGRVYPNQDLEFLIVFENEKKTPSVEAIAKTVAEHYRAIGYKVEPSEHRKKDCFEAIISFDREKGEGCVFGVAITTPYPFDSKHASLRAVCQRIC